LARETNSLSRYGKMSDDGTSLINKQQWDDLMPARVETTLNDDPYIKGLMQATPQDQLNNSSDDAMFVSHSHYELQIASL